LAVLISGCATGSRDAKQSAWDEPAKAFARSEDTGTCPALLNRDRAYLLEVADPENFPATRYRKGSRRLAADGTPKGEVDCSHFVHEVYKRAGLPYAFRPTEALLDAPEFEVVPNSEAKAGDLLVMRGHVGILDEKGKLISATLTRRRRAPSSITRYDLRNFRNIRGKRYVLRYRCRPAFINP
jgi:cell wall-associated NlpC family hydrolase